MYSAMLRGIAVSMDMASAHRRARAAYCLRLSLELMM